MGSLRFVVTPAERLTEAMWQRAYLSGMDSMTWQTRTTYENGELVIQRSVSDSATLQMPWLVPGRGWMTLGTSILVERARPYQLPMELVRGVVGQLRDQIDEWQAIGLSVAAPIAAKVGEAVQWLGRAAVAQDDPAICARWAEAALAAALNAADALAAAYVEQSFLSRRRVSAKQSVWLGADLGRVGLNEPTAKAFLGAFNAARVPMCWRDIEAAEGRFQWTLSDAQVQWCRAQGLKVCAGPLIDLDAHSLPDWLCLWEDDFDSVLSFATEFLRATVERYRGRVDLWICSGRMNVGTMLNLSEEDKLRLTARSVEIVRSLDGETPVVVSFDQPWAEYLVRRPRELPPLHLADALVRAGLKLSGLMLEINLGYSQQATYPRTILDVSRQLDIWSIFGLPLWISLTAPGDPKHPGKDAQEAEPATTEDVGAMNIQQHWTARYLPLLLAKPFVQGVLWNQLRDDQPRGMPRAGLFDAAGRAKPALRTLAAVRQTYLSRRAPPSEETQAGE